MNSLPVSIAPYYATPNAYREALLDERSAHIEEVPEDSLGRYWDTPIANDGGTVLSVRLTYATPRSGAHRAAEYRTAHAELSRRYMRDLVLRRPSHLR